MWNNVLLKHVMQKTVRKTKRNRQKHITSKRMLTALHELKLHRPHSLTTVQ